MLTTTPAAAIASANPHSVTLTLHLRYVSTPRMLTEGRRCDANVGAGLQIPGSWPGCPLSPNLRAGTLETYENIDACMAEAVPAAAAAVPADSPPSVLTALHGQPSALAPLEELLSVELNFSNLGGILQTLLKTAHAQQVQVQAAVGREQEMQDRIDALEARLAVVESDVESDGDGRPRSRSSSPSYKAAMAKAAALKQEAEQAAALAREQEAALAKAREESALMRERMEGQVAAPEPQPSPPPALPSPQAGAGRESAGGGGGPPGVWWTQGGRGPGCRAALHRPVSALLASLFAAGARPEVGGSPAGDG